MKIFKQFKFLNRFAKIPREIFTKSKMVNLTTTELDIIFKLLNFKIENNKITPNLSCISEKSGTSIRTYQRAFSSLKEKGYLGVSQNKNENGQFSTNQYNIDGLFSQLDTLSKQLYIDFDSNSVFGGKSRNLGNCSYVAVPKVLDFFQKKLDLTQKEILFIKYLFGYIDDSGISEVSLNIISRTTPLTRTTLQKIVASLQEKELIKVKEQFHGRTKIRIRNRYDITPLLKILNELERKKVENRLKEKGLWKDFNKERNFRSISHVETFSDKKEKTPGQKKSRIEFLQNEVKRLQLEVFNKESNVANTIREYQQEINDLKYGSIEDNSISNLMKGRFEKMKKNHEIHSDVGYQAKLICDKLNGNWKRSFNLYIKAVRLLPGTIDRFVGHAMEKAKYKEKYFAKCVSAEFKKLTLS